MYMYICVTQYKSIYILAHSEKHSFISQLGFSVLILLGKHPSSIFKANIV